MNETLTKVASVALVNFVFLTILRAVVAFVLAILLDLIYNYIKQWKRQLYYTLYLMLLPCVVCCAVVLCAARCVLNCGKMDDVCDVWWFTVAQTVQLQDRVWNEKRENEPVSFFSHVWSHGYTNLQADGQTSAAGIISNFKPLLFPRTTTNNHLTVVWIYSHGLGKDARRKAHNQRRFPTSPLLSLVVAVVVVVACCCDRVVSLLLSFCTVFVNCWLRLSYDLDHVCADTGNAFIVFIVRLFANLATTIVSVSDTLRKSGRSLYMH
jgi:hypothetical protein